MLIGWDIGIKNLAYCILEEQIENKPENLENIDDYFEINNRIFKIVDWNLINITDNMDSVSEDNKVILMNRLKPLCHYKIGSNQLCGKPAIYCMEAVEDNNYVGYCRNHFKRTSYTRLPLVQNNKCDCYYIDDEQNPCDKKASYVLRDNQYIGYCISHKNKVIKDQIYQQDELLKISNVKKTTHMDLTVMGKTLFNELDKFPNTLTASTVLLENQPVLKNPTMKSVQMFVYSYYIMKGIQNENSAIETIKCYSASKKLDIIKFLPQEISTHYKSLTDKIKSKYSRNKKLSVLITDYLLQQCPKWKPMFDESKKKDDLCDAFLMALHYLSK
jgi:hypothetical protein